jgi:hypothetical protein
MGKDFAARPGSARNKIYRPIIWWSRMSRAEVIDGAIGFGLKPLNRRQTPLSDSCATGSAPTF